MIALERTQRGFLRGEFADYYSQKCSIQKSSLYKPSCVWLGAEHESHSPDGIQCGARMHLTQEMAAELASLLMHFVIHGDLPGE